MIKRIQFDSIGLSEPVTCFFDLITKLKKPSTTFSDAEIW